MGSRRSASKGLAFLSASSVRPTDNASRSTVSLSRRQRSRSRSLVRNDLPITPPTVMAKTRGLIRPVEPTPTPEDRIPVEAPERIVEEEVTCLRRWLSKMVKPGPRSRRGLLPYVGPAVDPPGLARAQRESVQMPPPHRPTRRSHYSTTRLAGTSASSQ